MKNKTKLISIILVIIMIVAGVFILFPKNSEDKDTQKIKIVSTQFYQYDFLKEIINGKEELFELILLQDKGGDLHNYKPSAKDIINIKDSTLFIYNGGESDEWVNEIIKDKKSEEIVKLLDSVDSISEEHNDNHEGEDEHEAEEDHEEDVDHEGEVDNESENEHSHVDEHIWLSLRNAILMIEDLTDQIINIDKDNKSIYQNNKTNYIKLLDELDKEYKEKISNSFLNTIVVADRFPFNYFIRDYELKYYAAFSGCSTESEASFETITSLAKNIDEISASTVFILENSSDKIAKAVIENTKNKDQEIKIINSLQSINKNEIEDNINYYSIMKSNLETILESLN